MRYVRYVGLAHHRIITPQDWRRAGLNGETVVWNAFNGFAVPLDQFTDEQLIRAIEPDTSLIITGEGEEDGDKEFRPVAQNSPMTPAQAEQAATGTVDVLDMANGGAIPEGLPATSRGVDVPEKSSGKGGDSDTIRV